MSAVFACSETAVDLAWEDWLCAVEFAVPSTINSALVFDGDGIAVAYVAFCKGRTVSDYALEVVARPAETADV
jgi:hypothetical protein